MGPSTGYKPGTSGMAKTDFMLALTGIRKIFKNNLPICLIHLALKADRKRLKGEKFELMIQMKMLYGTLEEKEGEIRDFIRNYEQRM